MTRYPYAYDQWSAPSSPEAYLSTPASPSLDSPEPAVYYPSRPRPAEVEDFEGSDAEFAPRVVKPAAKPLKANKANEAKKVQLPMIITGMRSVDAPPVFDPSPSSPSVYSAYSEHSTGTSYKRGRPQRNSFYSINYMSDRGSAVDQTTTPVDAPEPLRGILKNNNDKNGNPRPERQPSRPRSRVRFPNEQAEEPYHHRQSKRFEDPPGPGSLVHEDSMDSNGTTRAEINYSGYKTRPSGKNHRDPSPVMFTDPMVLFEREIGKHPEYDDNSKRVPSPSRGMKFTDPFVLFERECEKHLEYDDDSKRVSSPLPRLAQPAKYEFPRPYEFISRPAPSPAPTSASAHAPPADEQNYTYYRPSPSPKPPLQRKPEYDTQYKQYEQYEQYDPYRDGRYKPYKQYERYSGYDQYNQSPHNTQYPPMEYRAGPSLAHQSPIFHSIQPSPVPSPVPVPVAVHPSHVAHPAYMEPRPRSSSDTYLSPPSMYREPGRPRSSSGTYLSPVDCYNTGPAPYYSPSSRGSGYPPPNFF